MLCFNVMQCFLIEPGTSLFRVSAFRVDFKGLIELVLGYVLHYTGVWSYPVNC